MFKDINVDELRNTIKYYEEHRKVAVDTVEKHASSLKSVELQNMQMNINMYTLAIDYLKEIDRYLSENNK